MQASVHAVGTVAGLQLSIKPSGAKSWILRTKVGSRRTDIGLGGYPDVPLAMAHERARETLTSIRSGVDPVAERRATRGAIEWTFKTCALAYIKEHKPSWKNVKHGDQWTNTLETYVYPHFGDKHVRMWRHRTSLRCCGPYWSTKNETMVRVRNRIELVLSWLQRRGHVRLLEQAACCRGHER
ncbi:MAG: DUF4102 domain-containing protein [Burkholderiales bacterium]|nr:DUF4102 domain-containing protein [Burkholderiales bacterium]